MTKSQKKELDRLLREAVFARDHHACRRCGKTEQLAPSHIYPKGKYTKMRWEPDNILTLCFHCHMIFWHRNPIEAAMWLETIMDKTTLAKLKLRTQINDKTPQDYEALKLFLKAERKRWERV